MSDDVNEKRMITTEYHRRCLKHIVAQLSGVVTRRDSNAVRSGPQEAKQLAKQPSDKRGYHPDASI